MSIFEYLMVMVAIVLGLGATQLLRGLGKIVSGSRRFAPVTLWAVTLFYVHIQVWWGFWDMSAVTEWNHFGFTFMLLVPCSLFAATELLVPLSSSPDTDWAAHFMRMRKWFFGAMVTFEVIALLSTWAILDVPLTHPYRITQGITLLAVVFGLVTSNRRAHTWIVLTYLGILVAGQALYRFLPGLAG